MNELEVSRIDKGSVVVLFIKGYLDAHTAPEFENSIQKAIDEKKYNIIVNFNGLNYISSAGLGVFMGFIEEIRSHGGDIKLTNMSQKVYKVFDLLGFPSLYEIFPDEVDAVKKFS